MEEWEKSHVHEGSIQLEFIVEFDASHALVVAEIRAIGAVFGGSVKERDVEGIGNLILQRRADEPDPIPASARTGAGNP